MKSLDRLTQVKQFNRKVTLSFATIILLWIASDYLLTTSQLSTNEFSIHIYTDAIGLIAMISISLYYVHVIERSAARAQSVYFRHLEQLEQSAQLLSFQKQALDEASLIFVTDNQGTIVEVNEDFCSVMAYTKNELIGANPKIFRSGIHSKEWYHEMWHQLTTTGIRKHEVCDRTKDGKYVWLDVTIVARRDQNGNISHFMAVLFDISKRKSIESKLASERERALAIAHAESKFIAHASHEIRTPMNALLGMTQLLEETHLSAEQRRFVTTMSSSGKHLRSLINDVLDFSKIEAGGLVLEARPVNLKTLISDIVSRFAPSTADSGVKLLASMDDSFPAHLTGDPLRLTQILSNLTSNAVKFTSQGEIVISARKKAVRESHIVVEFSVKDTGTGMSPEKLSRLFIPFSQGDVAVARTHGGTGLGLTICKKMVELMGGEIIVHSTEGSGSEFVFFIEMQIADRKFIAENPIQSTTEHGLAPFHSSISHHRIAVAEDNIANQILIEAILRRMGFAPIIVENGQELLNLMETTSIDLVLMDSKMPVMCGAEAARAIANRWGKKRPPIILVTASVTTHSDGSAFDPLLFEGILAKPIDFEALRETLKRFLADSKDEEQRHTPEKPANTIRSRVSLLRSELGDDGVVVQILNAFRVSADVNFQALLNLKPDDSADAKQRPAHSLAGSSWNVGANELATYLVKLEATAKGSPEEWKEEFDTELLTSLLNNARADLDEIIKEIKTQTPIDA